MKNKGLDMKNFYSILVQAWLGESHNNITVEDIEAGAIIPKLSEMIIIRPILWKLAKKIELVTQLKARRRLSSTPMQVSLYRFQSILQKTGVQKVSIHLPGIKKNMYVTLLQEGMAIDKSGATTFEITL